ncbi:hypothetical protein BN946_scf184930.g1 [Trametes cinnabarina]|uniref:Uncharacterized protein n=1 Tax=Pycnoporus cinnabarinus TaxID=5643 RepID=A0A060SJI4_PYCCI|nr:hypothetical protein BN946_scf184930.g1 [Trametes cinnabarina]
MVQNLHELSSFFQEDPSATNCASSESSGGAETPGPAPQRQLEARVAAILAKSTEGPDSDVPPTPFVDVFSVGAGTGVVGAAMASGLPPTYEEESEEDESDSDSNSDSDSGTESDLFEYDSPSFARFLRTPGGSAPPNGIAHSSH